MLGDPQLELFCGQTLGAGLDSFPHTNLLGPLTELQTAPCRGTVSTEQTHVQRPNTYSTHTEYVKCLAQLRGVNTSEILIVGIT